MRFIIRDSLVLRAELEIDAGFDFLDVERSIGAVSRESRRRQIQGLVAEAEIVVFDLGRPIRRKRIFKADARGPAGARYARARGVAGDIVQAVVIVRKGDAALALDQQPIERAPMRPVTVDVHCVLVLMVLANES